ncbi:Protein-tyrosine phosphatase [Aphelenchoides fujianensis]|nr:Protein-tyrosine phosphatase [Aphelenchoides fujianensis]
MPLPSGQSGAVARGAATPGGNSQAGARRGKIGKKRTTRRSRNTSRQESEDVAPSEDTNQTAETEEKENARGGRGGLDPETAAIMNAFVDRLGAAGVAGLQREYAELKAFLPPNRSATAFEANRMRNRYSDQLCYDATRVKLTYNVPPDVDYIHANIVDIPGLGNRFICAQASARPPLLTSIVHCSAGVGRTGTVVALAIIVARLLDKKPFTVFDVVKDLRCRRHNAVQTEAQYLFVHRTVCEYIQTKGLQRPQIALFMADYAAYVKAQTPAHPPSTSIV